MKKLILISALLVFSTESFAQEKYCWVSGENFHDIKVAVKKDCKEGDLLWVITNGEKLDECNIEQTI